jgi:hypothetical protein
MPTSKRSVKEMLQCVQGQLPEEFNIVDNDSMRCALLIHKNAGYNDNVKKEISFPSYSPKRKNKRILEKRRRRNECSMPGTE